jgi:hypothetical protein
MFLLVHGQEEHLTPYQEPLGKQGSWGTLRYCGGVVLPSNESLLLCCLVAQAASTGMHTPDV